MRCVVGNCGQPNEKVERCYWNYAQFLSKNNIEKRAYLDLCWYHQEFLQSQKRNVIVDGWDRVE